MEQHAYGSGIQAAVNDCDFQRDGMSEITNLMVAANVGDVVPIFGSTL